MTSRAIPGGSASVIRVFMMRCVAHMLVWKAWERYRGLIERDAKTDWPLLLLRALQLAEDGAGPRFDAIIVDEAQDPTAVQVRLLWTPAAITPGSCSSATGSSRSTQEGPRCAPSDLTSAAARFCCARTGAIRNRSPMPPTP
jgi:hypothetical protein